MNDFSVRNTILQLEEADVVEEHESYYVDTSSVYDIECDGLDRRTPAMALAEPLLQSEARPVHRNGAFSTLCALHTENQTIGYSRPEFLCVKVIKDSARVGIFLRTDKGATYISRISRDGLFAKTPLRPGDRIVSVCGVSCLEAEAEKVVRLMQAAQGHVSVTVHNKRGDPTLVSSTIQKPSKDAKVGVALKKVRGGSLFLSRVRSNGLFAGSLLMPGHQCLMINDSVCHPLGCDEAAQLIANAVDLITIVSRPTHERAIVLACEKQRAWWARVAFGFGVAAGTLSAVQSMT